MGRKSYNPRYGKTSRSRTKRALSQKSVQAAKKAVDSIARDNENKLGMVPVQTIIMEDIGGIVYDINLCGICQFSENINFTSIMEEYITEHGTTYFDTLKYIFPEVEWSMDQRTALICKVCLETIKEIADFKKVCLDMNHRRAFRIIPHNPVTEQIKVEIIPDPIEHALMHMDFSTNSTSKPAVIIRKSDYNDLSAESPKVSFDADVSSEAEEYRDAALDDYEDEIMEEELRHKIETVENDDYNEDTVAQYEDHMEEGERSKRDEIVEDINQSEGGEDQELISNVETENDTENRVQNDNGVNEEVNDTDDNISVTKTKESLKGDIVVPKYVPNKDERDCRDCQKHFRTWKALIAHVRRSHSALRKFHCKDCAVGFKSLDSLNRHMHKYHQAARNYPCTICSRKYITRGDLKEHMKFHDDDSKYPCGTCNAKFKTITNLRTHVNALHTDPKDYKYLCVMCGNKYSTSGALSDHIQHRHNTRSVSCTLCNKKFYAQKELKRHMVKHSDNFFECNVCDAKYKRKSVLNQHLTKQHGIGNYKFDVEKKFGCNICELKFVTQNKLKRHVRTHTGSRPYKCRLCDTSFICTSYIKGHLRTKHAIDVDAPDYDVSQYYDEDRQLQ